jgi:hypothetical protein
MYVITKIYNSIEDKEYNELELEIKNIKHKNNGIAGVSFMDYTVIYDFDVYDLDNDKSYKGLTTVDLDELTKGHSELILSFKELSYWCSIVKSYPDILKFNKLINNKIRLVDIAEIDTIKHNYIPTYNEGDATVYRNSLIVEDNVMIKTNDNDKLIWEYIGNADDFDCSAYDLLDLYKIRVLPFSNMIKKYNITSFYNKCYHTCYELPVSDEILNYVLKHRVMRG